MQPKRPVALKPASLRAAFKTDLAKCWKLARELHPRHQPYAFVLYGVEGLAYFTPQVLTEEGLAQVAEKYVRTGYAETYADAQKSLRYSVADSPLFAALEDELASVEALLQPHEKFLVEEEPAAYELLAKAAMAAFEELDQDGLFGKGKAREQLMLAIITEDTEKEWARPSIKKLNPPAVFQRFEADTKIEGKYASASALAFSPDERSLFFTGSAKQKPRQRDSNSEIVACAVDGFRLKRRWDFSFPSFGDSGRAIACSRNGKSLLVMRAKYTGNTGQAILMRFDSSINQVKQQQQITGEPADFAVSADDSRMAVTMHDGTLHLLDGNLAVLKVFKLPDHPYGLQFLHDGDLLVATAGGIFRIGAGLNLAATKYESAAYSLSSDRAGRILAASRWYTMGSTRHIGEFGFDILSLPSLEKVRTMMISGHQWVRAVVSPDGQYVAFEAKKIGIYHQHIVVCETETGREIARRKENHLNDMVFMQDNRTLVIACGCFTKTEPIIFWRIPGL